MLRREVVSFARRDGRHDHRHAQAWDATHAGLVVRPERGERSTSLASRWCLDAEEVFGRRAPLVVEIGSGTGDAVLAAAAGNPEVDHLAVEVYRPGAARTVVHAARQGLHNLRVLEADGRALLERGLPTGGVREVRVFFPDPWPKARHHKRRLVDAAMAAATVQVLEPGGVLRLATDWADYAEQMRTVCVACPGLRDPHDGGWAPRFAGRPLTRFEGKGIALGREIRDLEFVRRG